MSCTIIGALVVSCLVDPATRPTPAEAARILEPNQFVYVEPAPPMGPTVVIFGSSPADGPFGAFPAFPSARRLDGSLFSAPPWRATTSIGHPFHLNRPYAPVGRAYQQTTRKFATDHRPTHDQVQYPVVPSSVGPEREQANQGSKASPRSTGWQGPFQAVPDRGAPPRR